MRPNKIDEKIRKLIDFCKSYPELWTLKSNKKERDIYFSKIEDEKERTKLQNEYKKAKATYSYITRHRKYIEEQYGELFQELINAGVGGVFGYNNEVVSLAEKYFNVNGKKKFQNENEKINAEEKFMKFLAGMSVLYGGMDNFRNAYVESLITGEEIIPEEYRDNFIRAFDLNQPDYIYRQDSMYTRLLEELYNKKITIVDYDGLECAMDEAMERRLSAKGTAIIKSHCGLNGSTETLEQISKKIGISRERVRQIEEISKNKLRDDTTRKMLFCYINEIVDVDAEEEFIRKYFEYNDIFVGEKKELDQSVKEELQKIIEIGEDKKEEREENVKILSQLPKTMLR